MFDNNTKVKFSLILPTMDDWSPATRGKTLNLLVEISQFTTESCGFQKFGNKVGFAEPPGYDIYDLRSNSRNIKVRTPMSRKRPNEAEDWIRV